MEAITIEVTEENSPMSSGNTRKYLFNVTGASLLWAFAGLMFSNAHRTVQKIEVVRFMVFYN